MFPELRSGAPLGGRVWGYRFGDTGLGFIVQGLGEARVGSGKRGSNSNMMIR